MNGLLLINKDKNMTSRDVINKLNHIFSMKKIGHTGTLDPLATGVMVCLFGKYTKLVDLITGYDKEYIAEIKLGVKTDTLDITGNVIETKKVKISNEDILQVFNEFPKEYMQEVPIYSAVKINGKKLYEYARNNKLIELPKRKVNIYNLELISYNKDIITFKVKVSKGTYIRSLINDLCEKLNTIGTMNNLIRIKQGNFDIKDSYKLEDVAKGNYQFQNIKEFLNYPVIEIPDKYIKKIENGNKIENIFNINDKVIFTHNKKDLAIYENKDSILYPLIVF